MKGNNMIGTRYNEIVEKYGKEYALRQLAEECNELSQAALKLIRAWRKETPMREDEAYERLVEELADVWLMSDLVRGVILNGTQEIGVCQTIEEKEKRMYERMLDGKMEEDVW